MRKGKQEGKNKREDREVRKGRICLGSKRDDRKMMRGVVGEEEGLAKGEN